MTQVSSSKEKKELTLGGTRRKELQIGNRKPKNPAVGKCSARSKAQSGWSPDSKGDHRRSRALVSHDKETIRRLDLISSFNPKSNTI